MSQDITVKVPATSANIGSGFDALGLALSLYNEVSFRKTDEGGLSLVVEGLGQGKITTDFEKKPWWVKLCYGQRLSTVRPCRKTE